LASSFFTDAHQLELKDLFPGMSEKSMC
jgi:hypothetical protein